MNISNGHHQIMASRPLNEILPIVGYRPKPSSSSPAQHQQQEANPRAQPEKALRCPRCDSTNTKFCYYNNYSLSQPRYFCKGCRRYWTKGGSLRNVPVGGGCRKNKRSSSTSSASTKKPVLHHERQQLGSSTSLLVPTMSLPQLSYEPSDLSLSFSSLQNDPFLIGNHNPNSGRTHGLYYGFSVVSGQEVEGGGEDGVMLPFDHGEVGVSNSTSAEATGVVMANVSIGSNGNASTGSGSLRVNSVREYWNGVGSSSWHGLINSSLM